jgi:serine phosphatase RsbU (regulator of sigma subunit)
MGSGIAAAILMATVRATLRAVADHPPAKAIRLAEKALYHDLEISESFVTLFHAQLDLADRRLTYIDCGHGYEFIRHGGGEVETFRQRGLPLGMPVRGPFREGTFLFAPGDTLVLYSDGLLGVHPELRIDNRKMASAISGADSAQNVVDRLFTLLELSGQPPDDLTLMVLRCRRATQ